MKKLVIIFLLITGFNLYSQQESSIPEWLHLRTDVALIIGNTHWPEPAMGISNHTRVGFDIWESDKATGSIETGINFNFQTAPVSELYIFGSGFFDGQMLADYENHVISLQWSLGHTFRMLENRRLFLSLYAMLGYSWRITSISNIENSSYLILASDGLEETVGAFTSSFSFQLGYDFHDNVGAFFKGSYLVPVEPGVHGNYIFGFGLSFNGF